MVYDDERWGCKLFLNYKDNTNNEAFIVGHLSRELKMDEKKISLEYVSQKISEKISGSDGQRKLYLHKLYLAKIKEFPSELQSDTFVFDGRQYHWKSIIDLENDPVAMEKNADLISFVKENI